MSVYHLLITGSRECTPAQARFVRQKLDVVRAVLGQGFTQVCVVQGGARGVDAVASNWAQIQTYAYTEEHPANWETLGKRAGPVRNGRMVSLGAHACLAFPGSRSIGTYDCIRRAKEAGIPTHVFPLSEER